MIAQMVRQRSTFEDDLATRHVASIDDSTGAPRDRGRRQLIRAHGHLRPTCATIVV